MASGFIRQSVEHGHLSFSHNDFFVCDEAYGKNLVWQDCLEAALQLPDDDFSSSYSPVGSIGPRGQYLLPMQKHVGSSPPPVISTTPLALRVMGELIAQICPKDEGGDGGFHTFRFQKLIEWSYTGALESGGWRSPPPVDAAFFTVTVSGTAKTFAPGNTDPGVPAQLVLVSEKTPPLPHNAWYIFEDLKQFWWKRSLQMVRGGKEPWW
ncbi:hypothetical protein MMC06_006058 [Schaereria dolodes]|nr:hypothetical protein [Schaereria dolodes]